MRVFVLNVGRCGSITFAKACHHITNYTARHESPHPSNTEYPDNHIEVDNRLLWFLPVLKRKYPDSFWIHLKRNFEDSLPSLKTTRIVEVFDYFTRSQFRNLESAAKVYYRVGNEIISSFCDEQEGTMSIHIENPVNGFTDFWESIGAEGDFDAAMKEFLTRWNSSGLTPKA